ncbi:MAG: hypothetical protein ABEJ28_03500 [Salinigranum sp.]
MAGSDESSPDGDLPSWWAANRRDKEGLGLPPYEPPRFEDGTYTHEVVEPLEAEHDCSILFIGVHVRYEDDWQVRVDGEPAFPIGRSRDENGNTVYHTSAGEFRAAVESALDQRE